MCWFTLTPAKGKRQAHRTSGSSCVEDIVRVHRSPTSPRFTDTRVRMPNMSLDLQDNHALLHPHLQHQHRHPHIHPLLSHPVHGHHHHHHPHLHGHNALGFDFENVREIKLGGPGRKRSSSPPPMSLQPREPTRSPPSPPPPASPTQEPIYHTQVVMPSPPLPGVRQTTRAALHRQHQSRTRLRRVAGYEVLGKQVPWDWDCVSSTVGSGAAPGGGRWVRNRASNLKYPPFGGMERWL